MGARGVAPKPADLKQGRNQTTRLTVIPGDTIEIPPCQPGLLKSTQQAWDEYWKSDVAQAAKTIDLPALRRLFFYYDQWERMARTARKNPFSEGSKGQTKAHPATESMLKFEREISRLEGEMGMTPYARSRLGLSIGKAKLTAHELNRIHQAPDSSVDPEIAGLLEGPA